MKKIRFVTEFVSPTLGNVWIGRIMAADAVTADKMIKMNFAEEVQEDKNGDSEHSDTNGNQEPLADRPKRRGRPPANLS